MKKFKKVVAMCMSLMMLFSMGTMTAMAEEISVVNPTYMTKEGLMYTTDENGTGFKIVSYSGTERNIVIPSEIDGKKVTYIGEEAFKNNGLICSVELPSTLYKVEKSAFEGCTNLNSVTFGANTKWVATRAFAECPNLVEIQLPKNIKILGSEAFLGTGITEISIPKSLIETHYDYKTGNGPFGGTGLSSVEFDNGVSIIGRGMFAGAESLTAIEIPETVTEIADHAFEGTGFVDITIPNSVTEMGTDVFRNCVALKNVKLSENLEAIESWAFYGSSIETLEIPKSVKDIGGHVFENCASLKSIIIPNTVMTLGGNAFENCTALEEVVLSNSITYINEETFLNCSALKEIVIPYKVNIIRKNTFMGCTSLERVTLPRSIGDKSIELEIFDWNTNATINTLSAHAKAHAEYRKFNVESVEVHAESVDVVNYIELKLYEQHQLILDIAPIDFTDGVSIVSLDETLVTVSDTGKLKASDKNSGYATVTVTVGNIVKEITVKVGYDMGDVTMDYKLNARDALAVLKHSAEIEELESANEKLADINNDGKISSKDALVILKISAGLDVSGDINPKAE